MTREQLVESATQSLCILLDHRAAPRHTAPPEAGDAAVAANVYMQYLQRIGGEPHFREMGQGLAQQLASIIHAQNTYLPSARRTVSAFQELLVLLWKTLEINPVCEPTERE
jgi:hypothetical protein